MAKFVIPEDMDVPGSRRDIEDLGNVRWLLRNLGVRNTSHPDFQAVIDWCKARVRDNDMPKWQMRG